MSTKEPTVARESNVNTLKAKNSVSNATRPIRSVDVTAQFQNKARIYSAEEYDGLLSAERRKRERERRVTFDWSKYND